jgi:hypothetical protein
MNLRKLAIPIFVLLLAGAGLYIYRLMNQPTQQADDFRTILNLTPGDLFMNCGQPSLNTIGVVGDSAGVQDLHYHPSETDEIVFRFITEDDTHWQSLGAWEHVNAIDALGVPVSATAAVHRFSCAGKSTDQSSLRPDAAEQPGRWTAALATVLNPIGLQEMIALAQQPQTPWVVRAPSEGFLPPPPHANPYYDSGDSGVVHDNTPCPPNAQPCIVVSSAEFNDGMNRVILAERDDDFQAAIDRLTRRGTVVVRLPAQGDGRDAAINGVVRLEVKAINIIAVRLRDDIVRLFPTDRDSGEMKTKKLTALLHNEQVRRVLWKQAVAANRPSPSVVSGGQRNSNTLAFNTKALERMVQIHLTGTWP